MPNLAKVLKLKWPFLLLAIFLIGIDQYTKSLAVTYLTLGEPNAFLPFFNFTLLYNYGAAFSFLSDSGGWQRWLFTFIALAVSVLLLFWILKPSTRRCLELASYSCILAGALGNLWDRMTLGYVVDFVDWFYPSSSSCLPFFYQRLAAQTCHWPAFNIADAVILIGIGLLVIDMLVSGHKEIDS